MQKIWSIGISFLILCQSMNIHWDDIVQFDELIEHSQFHKEQYGDGFFVFLSKHYGSQKAEHSKRHQEEEKDHEKLPFQNHLQVCATSVFGIRMQPIQLNAYLIENTSEKADNFYYQTPYTSLFNSRIFQPPRQA